MLGWGPRILRMHLAFTALKRGRGVGRKKRGTSVALLAPLGDFLACSDALPDFLVQFIPKKNFFNASWRESGCSCSWVSVSSFWLRDAQLRHQPRATKAIRSNPRLTKNALNKPATKYLVSSGGSANPDGSTMWNISKWFLEKMLRKNTAHRCFALLISKKINWCYQKWA